MVQPLVQYSVVPSFTVLLFCCTVPGYPYIVTVCTYLCTVHTRC